MFYPTLQMLQMNQICLCKKQCMVSKQYIIMVARDEENTILFEYVYFFFFSFY